MERRHRSIMKEREATLAGMRKQHDRLRILHEEGKMIIEKTDEMWMTTQRPSFRVGMRFRTIIEEMTAEEAARQVPRPDHWVCSECGCENADGEKCEEGCDGCDGLND